MKLEVVHRISYWIWRNWLGRFLRFGGRVGFYNKIKSVISKRFIFSITKQSFFKSLELILKLGEFCPYLSIDGKNI